MLQRSRNGSVARGIEKRGPNQFRAKIRRKGVNEARTFETETEARRWLEIKKGEIAGESHQDRTREKQNSLRDVLQRYLADVTPTKRGQKAEKNRILAWMREPWTALPMISISSQHITTWREGQVAAKKAPSTINNALNLLSNVFRIAIGEWGYKIPHPLEKVKRIPQRKPRSATPNDRLEKQILLAAADSRAPWLSTVVRIGAWTAMRQGEIRQLRWEWIDFANGVISLPDATTNPKDGKEIEFTKNGDGRGVPILPIVEAALRSWAGSNNVPKEGWVFPSITRPGQAITTNTVAGAFQRLMKKVAAANPGEKRITFHDLRHWGCTRLAPLHVDGLDLCKTTGHKDVQSLSRYFNPDPLERAERIKAIAAAKGIGVDF